MKGEPGDMGPQVCVNLPLLCSQEGDAGVVAGGPIADASLTKAGRIVTSYHRTRALCCLSLALTKGVTPKIPTCEQLELQA